MFRPTLQSKLWLGAMAIAFIALFYWAETSRVTIKADHFDQKVKSAEIMNSALKTLQDYRLPGGMQSAGSEKDPLTYTMLGEKDSPITTDEGRIQDKITVLNPNFSAVVVDLMSKAGLHKNDTIAVMMTGSMPGANIAVYSAAKALGVIPISITSVGSSWWGANSPDFTWLDMERVLYDAGVFDYRSVAASMGGGDDEGGLRLSEVGKDLIYQAVTRNEVTLIHEGSLTKNVEGRVKIFEQKNPLDRYKAVINVGGGIAAIGHRANASLIPEGFSQRLPSVNYPNVGVLHSFSNMNVPIIQLYDVDKLAIAYDLPRGQIPLPKTGTGLVFEHQRYNLAIAWTVLIIMLVILGVVKFFDRKQFQWREENEDPDTLI